MGLFGRRKARGEDHRDGQPAPRTIDEVEPEAGEEAVGAPAAEDASDAPAAALPKEAPEDRAQAGPFDESEADDRAPAVDLGALRIPAREGMELRLDVDEQGQRIVAATLSLQGSSLQLQAFAEPRSEGVWADIRAQIVASVKAQRGTATERDGFVGTEVFARMPARTADGRSGWQAARFVGVDGPRWFLRGVITGEAAKDAVKAAAIEEVFRHTVVVRGAEPVPPRELLAITVPAGTGGLEGLARDEDGETFDPLARGPEITEIR